MSYQSQFTGEQIDALLNKINNENSSNIKVLFEGEFCDVQKMSPVNFLADSIYNYDLVAIVGYQKMDGGALVRQMGTILTPSTLPTTDAVGSALWSINNFADANQMGYFFDGNFGDGTQLCISAQRVGTTVSSRKHGICKVVGIKTSVGGSSYKEVDLISEPVEYDMTYNVLATIGKDLTLSDDITNYNEIVFLVETKNAVNEAYIGLTNVRMLVSEIIYSNDDTASVSGSSFYLTLSHGTNNSDLNYWRHCTAGVHFKTGTTLRVRNTITNTANYTKFRIKAIKGIKY